MPSAPASSHARELDVDGFRRHGLHGARHLGRRLGRRAERHAAVPHVGARDVDLDNPHLLLAVDALAAVGILLDREARDVGDDGFVEELLQARQLLGDHVVDAGVLQPHGVDHARRALGDARRGVAEARLARRPLEGERPEDVDVVEVAEFGAVAERAAGRDDRIVQSQAAQYHRCVYHTISPFSSTGPSLQMRLFPYFVLHEQPMQAPNPQPMRSSKESCPCCGTASARARSIGSGPQA